MGDRSTLHVDCDSCSARGPACNDCVVTVLLGLPGPRVDLDDDEQQALSALAGSGLVPPLRLVPRTRPVRSVPSPAPAHWEGLDDPGLLSRSVSGSDG
jgi:hypothetical protein